MRLVKIQTVELVWPRAKYGRRNAPWKNFGMVPTWNTKKEKTSKFVDAGGFNRNEKEGNLRLGMSRQRRVEKENKFTLDTERCENIKNLHTK